MNKPFVALLCALTVMATVNMVVATGPMIQKVFVTNWPQNQNVTVTNPPAPPTINLNVTAGKPVLNLKGGGIVQSVTYPQHTWSTNFTLNVVGYRNLVVGMHMDLATSALLNQSQPYNTSLPGGGTTTLTYYNLTMTNGYFLWSSGPVAGLDTSPFLYPYAQPRCDATLYDSSAPPNSPCVMFSYKPDPYQGTLPETNILNGVRPLGPNLTVYVTYYRVIVSGYYYFDCSPLLRHRPPADCQSDILFGRQIGASYVSDTTNATITVYSTD